jgi:hypothetical protein
MGEMETYKLADTGEPRVPIRVNEIPDRLTTDAMVTALVINMEELSIAEALVLVNGAGHGSWKYMTTRGVVFPNGDDKEPTMMVPLSWLRKEKR